MGLLTQMKFIWKVNYTLETLKTGLKYKWGQCCYTIILPWASGHCSNCTLYTWICSIFSLTHFTCADTCKYILLKSIFYCLYHFVFWFYFSVFTSRVSVVCMCTHMRTWACSCHSMHVAVRGQLCGVAFFLLPLCGFQWPGLPVSACGHWAASPAPVCILRLCLS